MSVKIRLRRTGKRNAACHRIVVADSRSPRDGRFIEIIGVYDPRHEFERIDLERVDYWIPRGAQPSETVSAIIKRARAAQQSEATTAQA
ncbi:MAG: 30S ribosomal protein S16 [Lentisphaerae bacterium]|jgi:small subunit ribosomal protein S16|nr:30S ribosomal protein S16 [Lentisphaerota bacterium]